jgi:hypothetical protein
MISNRIHCPIPVRVPNASSNIHRASPEQIDWSKADNDCTPQMVIERPENPGPEKNALAEHE